MHYRLLDRVWTLIARGAGSPLAMLDLGSFKNKHGTRTNHGGRGRLRNRML